MRPFRFLAEVGVVETASALRERAHRAEAIGYAVMVIPDHLVIPLGPIATLATVAAATTRLRIGTFVLNNDLRHPMVLAQELATLDVLSEGRLEIAIGAGWNIAEYAAAGIPFDRWPTRFRAPRGVGGRPQGTLRGGTLQLRRRALHAHRG